MSKIKSKQIRRLEKKVNLFLRNEFLRNKFKRKTTTHTGTHVYQNKQIKIGGTEFTVFTAKPKMKDCGSAFPLMIALGLRAYEQKSTK